MKIMDEKKERTEIIIAVRSPPPPSPSPSVLKPFVNGGLAGLLTGFISGALDYSLFQILKNVAHFRNHPTHVPRCIDAKMIPGMVFIDAFAYSQILGIYEILRRKAIASNDGMRPRLYQEAASGLIAGAAGAYLSFPFFLACYNKQVESMGPIAKSWRLGTSKWSHVFRNGGPWLKPRIGLGMGMVASYNPSLHYLRESWGFSEGDAKFGAAAISTLSAAACAQLVQPACFIPALRQTLKSKGPLGLLAGLSVSEAASKVLPFWFFFSSLSDSQPFN